MKKIFLIMALLLVMPLAFSLSGPITANGNSYYVVTATDATEDTGDEVCAKVGMICQGYTDTTSAACLAQHPTASVTTSTSGDLAGVFCDGAPQKGVCGSAVNTCHTCPTCSKTVDCSTPIGGLYREMFVQCAAPVQGQTCKVVVAATNTRDLLTQIGGVNQQLQACPKALPAGASSLVGDGTLQIDITMDNGVVESLYLTVSNSMMTAVSRNSPGACKKKVTTTETILNRIMASSDPMTAAMNQVGFGKVKVNGCTVLSKIGMFFVNPFAKPILKKAAPTLPPPPPAPNCGQVGEQCNNRGCFSGVCGTQKTQNANGQWGNWNYECLDVSKFDTLCVGRGNSPAPWSCLTGICR